MTKVNLFQVKDGVLEAVASSFGKTIDELNQDVEILQKWLRTQNHLPDLMDEKQIQNFLILNKCKLEKTKRKLENYYSLRSPMAFIFQQSNPKLSVMKEVLDSLYLVPLPVLTENLYRVFVIKMRDRQRCEVLNPYGAVSQILNIQEIRLMEDVAYGDIFIIDVAAFPLKFLLKITPKFIYNVNKIYETVYSARLKALYVLNASFVVRMIVAFAKTLVKMKIFERIHICSDETSLQNQISKEILPKEYGGDGQSLNELQDMVKAKLVEYQDRFDQLDQIRINQAVRSKNDEISDLYK